MSTGYLLKASVANGAGTAVFFGASPESKAVSATGTEDDDPPGMEALYADLSAAGAGAGGVEVVLRDEGGPPVRLTSWAKSSVTPSIKHAGYLVSNEKRPQTRKEPPCFPTRRRTTTGPRMAAVKYLQRRRRSGTRGICLPRGRHVFACFTRGISSRVKQVPGGRCGVGRHASYRRR